MKNAFAEDWKKEQEVLAAYQIAKDSDDDKGMKAALLAHRELNAAIAEKGAAYWRIYRLYAEARERGNKYIDFNEVVEGQDIEGLIASLREFGIEAFTFSSTWSSAVETAWLFTQNGCALEGLVEINGRYKSSGKHGYDKAHGYLFRVA